MAIDNYVRLWPYRLYCQYDSEMIKAINGLYFEYMNKGDYIGMEYIENVVDARVQRAHYALFGICPDCKRQFPRSGTDEALMEFVGHLEECSKYRQIEGSY